MAASGPNRRLPRNGTGRLGRDSAAGAGVGEGRLSMLLQTSTITTYAPASRLRASWMEARAASAGIMPIELTFDHTGPMTATVEDNALLLEVLAGPDWTCPALVERHWVIRRPFFRTEPGL
jgi:amidase